MNILFEQNWDQFRSADKKLDQASKTLGLAIGAYISAREDLLYGSDSFITQAQLDLIKKMVGCLNWHYKNSLQSHVEFLRVVSPLHEEG
jgi:hypothetical protein